MTAATTEECKCYRTNDFDFYPAVILGIESEWVVTQDCPVHKGKDRSIEDFEKESNLRSR